MISKNIKKSQVVQAIAPVTQMEEEKVQQPVQAPAQGVKGRQKLAELDPRKCKLLTIGFPKKVENPLLHAKYQVEISYLDDLNKEHKKTIKFGEKTVSYYAETGDEVSLRLLMSKLRNYDSWTKPSFYVYHLLCKKPDIREAYSTLLTLHTNGNI